jgi:hypothetical protein
MPWHPHSNLTYYILYVLVLSLGREGTGCDTSHCVSFLIFSEDGWINQFEEREGSRKVLVCSLRLCVCVCVCVVCVRAGLSIDSSSTFNQD